jgi:quercetin dioxygenase-like cupin family protein
MAAATTAVPVVRHAGDGEARWFLGALGVIKASGTETAGGPAVIEWRAARGHGSPLHVHRREDEWFYVLSGEVTLWVDGRVVVASAGSFVYGPRNVPHTFSVTSDEARFLLVTQPAGFEEFVRAVSVPAESLEIPPPASEPPDLDALVVAAAGYGIEITGPPGIPG